MPIHRYCDHTQIWTTARYAHLDADPVNAAAEQVSAAITRSISSQPSEEAAVNE